MAEPVPQEDAFPVQAVVPTRRGHHPRCGFCACASSRFFPARQLASLNMLLHPSAGCPRSLQPRSMLQACSSLQALASDPGPWQWKKTVLLQRAPPICQPLPPTSHRYVTSIRYSPKLPCLDVTKLYKRFSLGWSMR